MARILQSRFLLVVIVTLMARGGMSAAATNGQAAQVQLMRVPDGGSQPQVAVDAHGVIHLVYYKGEAPRGDIYYVRSSDAGATFSQPLRVNSQPESAIAAGTIRGAQMALGAGGRVHVAWNGSIAARPKGPLNPEQASDSPHNGVPMLYTRINDQGTAFEPQRNLMQKTFALDGGGAIAADSGGNVYVFWHGNTAGDGAGESNRRVWLARSSDHGKTFAAEEPAYARPTGACACCGMRAFAEGGNLYVLFRSAQQEIHRDEYLLTSRDQGRGFEAQLLHPWQINACPMTSSALQSDGKDVVAAWETAGQVYFSRIAPGKPARDPIAAPGESGGRKHPSLAVDREGRTLLVWTNVAGWGKGGAVNWQLFDREGKALDARGEAAGVPPFSFAAAFEKPGGGFVILY